MLHPAFLLLCAVCLAPADEGRVGKRPYEMVWAGREADAVPPLVDFEDLSGWKAQAVAAEARFEQSREQQIWGRYAGKLTYRATGRNPVVRIVPAASVPIAGPFDAVTLWVYGNNWAWSPDPSTPQVSIDVVFEDAGGKEFSVNLYRVNWKEWYLLHRRLSPVDVARVRGGARFKAIVVRGGVNTQDRVLYLDNLAVFVEKFPPLEFEPRPLRGIPMFEGETTGTNTGPGKLPFPTRPETILPSSSTEDFTTELSRDGDAFVFTYAGKDGKLFYRVTPRTGTLGDITARWQGRGGEIRPCAGGGVFLDVSGKPVIAKASGPPQIRRRGDVLECRWRLGAGSVSADVTTRYRLWAKSLVVDVIARGGKVAEVRYGAAEGLERPRLVKVPFYLYNRGVARPAIAVSGPPEAPLFLAGNTDWCLSGASVFWAANSVTSRRVAYNGGTRYVPKTDGKRNDCYERLFVTLAPRLEEVLPTIPNPVSPYKHVTGTRVWRAHGASDRKRDAAHWTECHRYGMRQVIVTDHETGWRDGGESFTFRTRAAPGKGGDEGQFEYARLMQDKLGFVYGPYNNFTDFAPVNRYWSFDMVSRTPDNQLQHAWARCYAPKPARAVEYCARLAPEIERKFHFSTAYCDVHTCVAPWDRVDYDPRVPGAGTLAAVYYAYGEIMLLQKKAWGGPVYSEGTYHYLYCGLTDGNYGQDNPYRIWKNPWLVDFDLRKMHDLCCNFGMGNPGMFYGRGNFGGGPEKMSAQVDRFLAATVAFGHPGFLVYEGGIRNALRSYYMLQQLHSRYCLARAVDIRYADAEGRLLETTDAVAGGVFRRSQVVTRYSDGTVTAANGSTTERLRVKIDGRSIDLPPNGYTGWTADGSVFVFSGERDGHRADCADTPAYIYVDGRGTFTRFERAASDAAGICRKLEGDRWEMIPVGGAECGFAVKASTAKAMAKDGRELGSAKLRRARGLTYVVPVEGAFSYVLEPAGDSPRPVELRSSRVRVVPGETVRVAGKEDHSWTVPRDARPGTRLWERFEDAWIDFVVVSAAAVEPSLEKDALCVRLTSRLAAPERFEIRALGRQASAVLEPGRPAALRIPLEPPRGEADEVFRLGVRSGSYRQGLDLGMQTRRGTPEVAPFPDSWEAGMRLRGCEEVPDVGATGAYVHAARERCGGVEKACVAMHPPYRGGVGYVVARYGPIALPAGPPAALRAVVGKGDGSDPGDGILFEVAIVDSRGQEAIVARKRVTRHAWVPLEADLSPWAGRTVQLKLIADVGPEDNSTGDWARWADVRIETLEPRLVRTLTTSVGALRHEPGPFPSKGLTVDRLRRALRGWIHYDGKGLAGTGKTYGSLAVLNGVVLGSMAPAAGREDRGVFQQNAAVALTPAAIRALGLRNTFAIRNPGGDSFSVRRFWIELELKDGTRCSSDISTATYTQPSSWLHAEGIGVPAGEEIQVTIWFPRS